MTLKERHQQTLQRLRDDTVQLLTDMDGDFNQLRLHLYNVAEDAAAASARVHRQLTDAWQNNNQQLFKMQAATRRELACRSGLKKLHKRVAALRSEQTTISNQLRHDTMQAAGMVSSTHTTRLTVCQACACGAVLLLCIVHVCF